MTDSNQIDIAFDVPVRDKNPLRFTLKGKSHVLVFQPPKQAVMVLPMLDAKEDIEAAKAAFEWLDDGLSEDDQKHIEDRLRDEKDDLDIDTITEVVKGLVAKISGGRPTT